MLDIKVETQHSCCRLFLYGLPENYRDKIIVKQGLDPDDPSVADFKACHKQATEIWEREFKSDNFTIGSGGELDYDNLV